MQTGGRTGSARVGVYPETKHPAHFAGIGLPLEQAVLDALRRFDYSAEGSPVFIQSFDPRNLRQLRGMTRLPLIQLLEHELGDVREIAGYADGIGIAKSLATPEGVRGGARRELEGACVDVSGRERISSRRFENWRGAGCARQPGCGDPPVPGARASTESSWIFRRRACGCGMTTSPGSSPCTSRSPTRACPGTGCRGGSCFPRFPAAAGSSRRSTP